MDSSSINNPSFGCNANPTNQKKDSTATSIGYGVVGTAGMAAGGGMMWKGMIKEDKFFKSSDNLDKADSLKDASKGVVKDMAKDIKGNPKGYLATVALGAGGLVVAALGLGSVSRAFSGKAPEPKEQNQ